ncbi:hypothetical protein ACFLYT_01490 [Nanoarchaeota archaeon]
MEEVLKKLEGKQTVETVAEKLGVSRESAVNLMSKLRKEGFVETSGGGKQKRIYTISTKKFTKKEPGMFDIINKYSKIKVRPMFIHEAHGIYLPENALADAINTHDLRVILSSLNLFNHIKNWHKLCKAVEGYERITGALYDLAKNYIKVRKMPANIRTYLKNKGKKIIKEPRKHDFKEIEKEWGVVLPFSKEDMEELR